MVIRRGRSTHPFPASIAPWSRNKTLSLPRGLASPLWATPCNHCATDPHASHRALAPNQLPMLCCPSTGHAACPSRKQLCRLLCWERLFDAVSAASSNDGGVGQGSDHRPCPHTVLKSLPPVGIDTPTEIAQKTTQVTPQNGSRDELERNPVSAAKLRANCFESAQVVGLIPCMHMGRASLHLQTHGCSFHCRSSLWHPRPPPGKSNVKSRACKIRA